MFIFFLCLFQLWVFWQYTSRAYPNRAADALSRNSLPLFFSLIPQVPRWVIPPPLLELLVTQLPDWGSQDWIALFLLSLNNRISQSTRSAYASGQWRYLTFCMTFGLQPLPFPVYTVCRFVAFLAHSGLSYSSICQYLSAIKHLHIAAGFPPTDTLQHPVLCYVLRRFLNTHPQYSRPRRLPITPYILLLLYCFWSSSPADYENSMLWAACCLAFFAFLRSGEFTCSPQTQHKCLALADIAVDSHSDPQLLWVCIQYSKTDQAGKGTTIALGRTRRILCPVASVLSFLSKWSSTAGQPCLCFQMANHCLAGDWCLRLVEPWNIGGYRKIQSLRQALINKNY